MTQQAADSESRAIVYRVDRNDRITSVSDGWEAFAESNECRSLPQENVVGSSLWGHIQDPVTTELYREMMAFVRAQRRRAQFQFRCDSPDVKRFMRMSIDPLPDGALEFRSELVTAEPRRVPFHVQASFRAFPVLVRCSVCNRVKTGSEWRDVVDAVEEGLVLNHDLPLMVAYGVCDECRDRVRSSYESVPKGYVPLTARP